VPGNENKLINYEKRCNFVAGAGMICYQIPQCPAHHHNSMGEMPKNP
jgi:hypothetical protein